MKTTNLNSWKKVSILAIITTIITSCDASTMEGLQTGVSFIVAILALIFGGIFVGGSLLSAKDGESNETTNKFGCWGALIIAAMILVLICLLGAN